MTPPTEFNNRGCLCIGEMSAEWQTRVDIIPAPAFLLDCHGVLRICNALVEEMVECCRAQLIGKNLLLQFDPSLRDELQSFCKGISQPSKPLKANGWLVGNTDRRLPISLCYQSVEIGIKRDHRGVLVIVSESADQLADPHNDHRQVVARLTRALDQTADMVMITDPAGTIEYVNSTFEMTTGYSTSEVLGKTPRILQSGLHEKSDYTLMWNTVLSGMPYKGVLANRKKDGSIFFLEETITPVIDSVGAITGFIATGRDITEKRRMEQELAQAQKMEAVGRLAGGIAHDFNNFLQVISGFTEMQLRGIRPQDPGHKHALRVLEAATRASDLVRQLLAFSRRQVLQPKKVYLSQVIEAIYPMMEQLLPRNITIELDVRPDSGCVLADPGQLEQVLMNLVLNARDAMPNGGKVRVILFEEQIDHFDLGKIPENGSGKYVILVVADDGMGIDPETRRHLFEPFFTTKEVGKGTGLGLATVLGIVKQSNGDVRCESEKGEGTKFIIKLPHYDSQIRLPSGVSRIQTGPDETVLLVEDKDDIRELIEEMLASAGYRVLVRRNGFEALSILREDRTINVVLANLILTDWTGNKLAEQAATYGITAPFLYMSGNLDDQLAESGYTRILIKPFTREQLTTAIRQVIHSVKGSSINA